MEEVRAALEAVGFEEPWDGATAREWWNLHMSKPE
jgi:hypothetical protein